MNICTTKSPQNNQKSTIITCLTLLLTFGLLYDRLTAYILRQPYGEEKSSLAVTLGVTITILIMAPITGLKNALWTLTGFTASGTPMILGQLIRHAQNYQRALNRL